MSSFLRKVEGLRRQRRVEEMLLAGVSNRYEMAAALGCKEFQIAEAVKQVYKAWKEQDSDPEGTRSLRMRMYENLYREALNSFRMSTQKQIGEQEVVEDCEYCDGMGKVEERPNEFHDCAMCRDGKVTNKEPVMMRVPGDVGFLRLAKDILNEITKYEGSGTMQVSARSMLMSAQQIGGKDPALQARVDEMVIEAPAETLLRAMTVIDELQRAEQDKARANSGPSVRVIEHKKGKDDAD
jgi:hypothetical protein